MSIVSAEPAAVSFLSFLVEAWARTIACASLVGLGLVCARRARAALRLSVWVLVLGVALSMPILDRIAPRLPILLPAAELARFGTAVRTSLRTSDLKASVVSGSEEIARFETRPAQSVPKWPGLSWPLVATVIYLCGVLVLTFRGGLGWTMTRRLERSARRIEDENLLDHVRRRASDAGLRATPRLLEVDGLPVPVAMSVLRPAIVLPVDRSGWTTAVVDDVLVHEIAHLARRDPLTQRLSLAYRAVAWVNPFSWWLHRHIAELAEEASDDAVLDAGADPTRYAEALVGFFRAVRDAPRQDAWNVAMAREADRNADRRVERILDWKPDRSRRVRHAGAVAIMLGSVSAMLLAAVAPGPVPVSIVHVSPEVIGGSAPAPARAAAPPAAIRSVIRSPAVTLGDPPASSPQAIGGQAPLATPTATVTDSVSVSGGFPPLDEASGGQNGQPFGQGASRPRNGIQNPVLLEHANALPAYTAEARQRKIAGEVLLDAVVGADGHVSEVRVRKSLDPQFGLDGQAVEAARQWLFRPAVDESGGAVPIVVQIEMTFSLGREARPTSRTAPIRRLVEVEPSYPPAALAARVAGVVGIDATIDPEGNVTAPTVFLSVPLLDDAAVAAVSSWKYAPTLVNGAAVPVPISIYVTFSGR